MAPKELRAIVAQLPAPDQRGRNVFTKKEGTFPGFLEACTSAARLPGCFCSVFWQVAFSVSCACRAGKAKEKGHYVYSGPG